MSSAASAAAIAFSFGVLSYILGTPADGAPVGSTKPPTSGVGKAPSGGASPELASDAPTGASGGALQWASSDGGGIEDGLDWLDAAPKNAGAERELYFYEAVLKGGARIDWSTVTMGPATIPVFARTLRIGKKRSVRIMVDFSTQQALADLLGCAMMSPAIANEVYKQAAVKLTPMLRSWSEDGTMSLTKRLRQYTLEEDAAVSPDEKRLVANEGKDWVVSIRFWRDLDPAKRFPALRSANYGWLSKNAPNGYAYQPVGLMHNFHHSDYSQQVRLVSQWWKVGGQSMHISQALKDPVLAPLIASGESCGSLIYCPNGKADLLLPAMKHPQFIDHSPTLQDGRPYPLGAGQVRA